MMDEVVVDAAVPSQATFRTRMRTTHLFLGRFASARSSLLGAHPLQGDPPAPEHWGGYVVKPATIEFWQGRQSRLHDRLRYTLQPDASWKIERLAP